MGDVLASPPRPRFHREGNRDEEQLSDLPKVTRWELECDLNLTLCLKPLCNITSQDEITASHLSLLRAAYYSYE